MRASELRYELPPELIAQRPVAPRDTARLLIVDRATGRIEHRSFRDISAYLGPADCLVLNDTRVLPARFFARRATGGRVEALFLGQHDGMWDVLLKPAGRQRVGDMLECPGEAVRLHLLARGERGAWRVRPTPDATPIEFLRRVGHTPLPPYIRRPQPCDSGVECVDAEFYQTVYAARPGAVAAPTAGLHFTDGLLDALGQRGIGRAFVTLHVGAGTFAPIETEELSAHRMHSEWFEAPAESIERLRAARAAGGRVVAVGTTAVRVLETLARVGVSMRPQTGAPAQPRDGWTDIFIYPPYAFENVDALVTNFHLPGSTLLALVMAFASRDLVLQAYREAIRGQYRFYSFGDAMLVL
jgi:S-adenosylmethionine:tRNA ribosyltransferase-isomerase